ncbi:MAG: DUF6452 family protein [Chitinophagaceae bacterium]
MFAFLLFEMACKQSQICLVPQLITIQGVYVSQDTSSTIKDTVLDNAIWLFGKDSLFYTQSRNTPYFSIVPSQIQDSSVFYFYIDSTTIQTSIPDTITLYSQRNLHFISSACGFQTYHELQAVKYSTLTIDSIYISDPNVDNQINKKHLQVVIKK